MTWQLDPSNPDGDYHLLMITDTLNVLPETPCGLHFLSDETLVGHGTSSYFRQCQFCQSVVSLVYTSITDAKASLNFVKDVKIVKAALKIVQGREAGTKTLIAMLERKIRDMEKHT